MSFTQKNLSPQELGTMFLDFVSAAKAEPKKKDKLKKETPRKQRKYSAKLYPAKPEDQEKMAVALDNKYLLEQQVLEEEHTQIFTDHTIEYGFCQISSAGTGWQGFERTKKQIWMMIYDLIVVRKLGFIITLPYTALSGNVSYWVIDFDAARRFFLSVDENYRRTSTIHLNQWNQTTHQPVMWAVGHQAMEEEAGVPLWERASFYKPWSREEERMLVTKEHRINREKYDLEQRLVEEHIEEQRQLTLELEKKYWRIGRNSDGKGEAVLQILDSSVESQTKILVIEDRENPSANGKEFLVNKSDICFGWIGSQGKPYGFYVSKTAKGVSEISNNKLEPEFFNHLTS